MSSGRTIRADVAVIGAGPAGATLATRLAQMGHDVCLLERSRFPRRHLGESLTPGVLPLLETSGARARVEAAGFPRVRWLDVDWDAGPVRRAAAAGEGGLLVDRGRFDALLLEHARAAGVRVLQPAVARRPEQRDGAWRIPVDADGRSVEVTAPFLAVASGRAPRPGPGRIGRPTLALYAYWEGDRLPDVPRIEAGEDAWFWGVPIPDGTYNTLVFVDHAPVSAGPREAVAERFHRLVRGSGLLAGCAGLRLSGAVRAVVATSCLDAACVTPHSIRVGDAALALDPLSSSGVQKALQSAVSGAIVVNTLVRRPERAELAMAFHRDALRGAFDRHAAWAAGYYATAATRRAGPFWRDRAAGAAKPSAPQTPGRAPHGAWSSAEPVRLSSRCTFVDVPCLDDELVTRRTAVSHPGLEEPVAYLAGWELVPLLREIPSRTTALGLVQAWSARLPPRVAFAIIDWLIERGLLDVGAGASDGRPVRSGGPLVPCREPEQNVLDVVARSGAATPREEPV